MRLFEFSAIQIQSAFVKGDISAKEIVDYFFRRIEHHNDKLGAFLTLLHDRARKKARLLDQKREDKKPLGKLAGIPIAIKDNMHIEGVHTTCGSKFLQNYKAPFTASALKYLEEEDALLIGKTNLDEFAMGSSTENSAYFPAYNPWDLNCSPGGSSGGSAVAVSARLIPLALGSDTGGSIRQPASFSGVVGFKPTYGRVSRYGLVAFGSSFDQIGPFATNTKDVGLMMEVMGRHCLKDSTSLSLPQESFEENFKKDLKGVTIGVPWNFVKDVKNDVYENFEKSIKHLKNLGAKVIDVDLDILKHSIAVYYILSTAEASTNLARFDGIRYGKRSEKAKTVDEIFDLSRDEGFGSEVKNRILLGTYVLSAGYQDAFYRKSQKVRTLIIQGFEKVFETCQAVVMPTAPSTAFESNAIKDPVEMYLQDVFTVSANLAGLPAISVPSGFDEKNKPFGLQFLAPQLHDVSLVGFAHAFESATKYTEKIPPLFTKEVS